MVSTAAKKRATRVCGAGSGDVRAAFAGIQPANTLARTGTAEGCRRRLDGAANAVCRPRPRPPTVNWDDTRTGRGERGGQVASGECEPTCADPFSTKDAECARRPAFRLLPAHLPPTPLGWVRRFASHWEATLVQIILIFLDICNHRPFRPSRGAGKWRNIKSVQLGWRSLCCVDLLTRALSTPRRQHCRNGNGRKGVKCAACRSVWGMAVG